jgi:hypothetical protein
MLAWAGRRFAWPLDGTTWAESIVEKSQTDYVMCGGIILGVVLCSALGPGRLKRHLMNASNMTLAAFTGTAVLDDGKVAIRSLAAGRRFIGEQQATESVVEKSQTDYVMCVGIMWEYLELCYVPLLAQDG